MGKSTYKDVGTPLEILNDLNKACKENGGKWSFALDNDLEPCHVSAWSLGKRTIPNHVLNLIGWERVTIYRRIDQ